MEGDEMMERKFVDVEKLLKRKPLLKTLRFLQVVAR